MLTHPDSYLTYEELLTTQLFKEHLTGTTVSQTMLHSREIIFESKENLLTTTKAFTILIVLIQETDHQMLAQPHKAGHGSPHDVINAHSCGTLLVEEELPRSMVLVHVLKLMSE